MTDMFRQAFRGASQGISVQRDFEARSEQRLAEEVQKKLIVVGPYVQTRHGHPVPISSYTKEMIQNVSIDDLVTLGNHPQASAELKRVIDNEKIKREGELVQRISRLPPGPLYDPKRDQYEHDLRVLRDSGLSSDTANGRGTLAQRESIVSLTTDEIAQELAGREASTERRMALIQEYTSRGGGERPPTQESQERDEEIAAADLTPAEFERAQEANLPYTREIAGAVSEQVGYDSARNKQIHKVTIYTKEPGSSMASAEERWEITLGSTSSEGARAAARRRFQQHPEQFTKV